MMKLQRLSVLFSAVAIGMFTMAGCSGEPDIEHPDVPTNTEGQHDHGHEGPHGGHIIELGDEQYHAELTHDEATHSVTVYILDGSATKASPIEAESLTINLVADGKPMQFALAAKPLDGEEGASSRFTLESEELLHEIEEEGSKPQLRFTVGEQQFSAPIELGHHDHDHGHAHDDHDHGEEGHDDHDHDDHDHDDKPAPE
ncbi:hypothetical protein [Symmachiella dynata]|uniref:hypothetical protein n=1 Tax=Symmachiella dynata TaxID=2527995 RepID=UPI0030EB2153|tara:strand:- start:195 stop:794 length:600 start_codon:yes stop_codon:yes gene_type:complete